MEKSPWKIFDDKKLGSGGNSSVYKVTNKSGDFFAGKYFSIEKGCEKTYDRFKREIAVLLKLSDKEGIMPIIDHHIPEHPSDKDRPYYIMPIAKSFNVVFQRSGLEPLSFLQIEEIVKSIAKIAKTLLILLESRENYIHRDIKPENLFKLSDGKYVIGDFGLVSNNSSIHITECGERIGSKWYIAPEMLVNNNEKITPEQMQKVDVYSLAKTLWKLITNEKYPLMGQHNVLYKDFLLSTYLNGVPFKQKELVRLERLDYLIERAVFLNPDKRISMKEFLNQLNIWSEKSSEIFDKKINWIEFDKINSVASSKYDRYILRAEQRKKLEDLIYFNKLSPLYEGCRLSNFDLNSGTSDLIAIEIFKTKDDTEPPFGGCLVSLTKKPNPRVTDAEYLHSGFGVRINLEGFVEIVSAHIYRKGQNTPEIIWKSERKEFIYNTPEQDEIIGKLLKELMENLPQALNRFS